MGVWLELFHHPKLKIRKNYCVFPQYLLLRHSCKKEDYAFMVLQKYIIIFLKNVGFIEFRVVWSGFWVTFL